MSKRLAFTLVEIVTATALTAVLMVAVLASLSTLSAKSKHLLRKRTAQGWQRRLAEQFEWDLVNARYLVSGQEELTLVGYGSRDFESGGVVHRHTHVVYGLQHQAGQNWLTRSQVTHSADTASDQRSDIMCGRVGHFHVETLGDQLDLSDKALPIPARLRIVVAGEDDLTVYLDRVFHVR